MRSLSRFDRFLAELSRSAALLSGATPADRPNPAADVSEADLTMAQRRSSGALMRVNHVGEVCAQALYLGHAATVADPELAAQFRAAARDEQAHLGWTAERLAELGDRPSRLNPVWYGASLTIGAAAGLLGRDAALAFMRETEVQVEQHLATHLQRLDPTDRRSMAIVAAMKLEESRHADTATRLGAPPMPRPLMWGMRAMAKVMTHVAARL